jgi:phosphohistidine phosphatase
MYRQSAALPYRWSGNDLEVLLVTSRKGKHWILPKGIVEPGMAAPESAAKEAEEEGGVIGEVSSESIGAYQYRKWGGTCHVEVYPLRVREELNEWEESSMRRRLWRSLPAALLLVDDAALSGVIARFDGVGEAPEA